MNKVINISKKNNIKEFDALIEGRRCEDRKGRLAWQFFKNVNKHESESTSSKSKKSSAKKTQVVRGGKWSSSKVGASGSVDEIDSIATKSKKKNGLALNKFGKKK